VTSTPYEVISTRTVRSDLYEYYAIDAQRLPPYEYEYYKDAYVTVIRVQVLNTREKDEYEYFN